MVFQPYFYIHTSHLEITKSCHQPTIFRPKRCGICNIMAAISWESLAPVIALYGCRGNMRAYDMSNRYYYHANTVSRQYLHIQSIPCEHLWCSLFTLAHCCTFIMNIGPKSYISSHLLQSYNISLNNVWEQFNWSDSEGKGQLYFLLGTWNLHNIMGVWWFCPTAVWKWGCKTACEFLLFLAMLAVWLLGWHCLSIRRSVQNRNIFTTTGWITMKFGERIHGFQAIGQYDFGDPLTFHYSAIIG